MNEPEIEQAVERVRGGNADDYRTIVAAYHQRLRAAVARLCPPGVDPHEIAHLSFIEAYRHLDRYQAGTNFFAWLCAIARHRLLAEYKRLQRSQRNQQSYFDRVVSERLEFSTEQGDLNDDRLRLLQDCVSELKPEPQALLNQRYRDRTSVESIALTLGRTASAVSVQLFALRQKLRECLERKWRVFTATNS